VTQYPSPYSLPPPPDFGAYHQAADVLAPARRAGVMLFVIGGLFAAFALCNGGYALVVSPEEIRRSMELMQSAGAQPSPFTPETLRTINVVSAAVILALGLGFILLGVFVRRGSTAAAVTAVILAGLVEALFLLMLLASLLTAAASPVLGLGVACMMSIPAALLGTLIVLLVQALRAAPRADALRQQMHAQYWQYQQQQAAYAQPPPPGYGPAGGYGGYGAYGQSQQPPVQGGYGYAAPPPQSPPPGESQSALPQSPDSGGGGGASPWGASAPSESLGVPPPHPPLPPGEGRGEGER
jgi:hypothetical protein